MNFMVRGAIFAWFPHYNQSDPRGREMVEQTVQRLKQLDAERPEVVLIPEPENPKDPKAVRVYCQGNPAGYVAHEQADKAQWLFDAMHPIVPARITRVEAESELRFYIEADLPEGVLPEPTLTAEASDAWSDWQCSIPKLPMPEVWKICQVLEFQIERQFPVLTLEQVKNLRTFIRQWIEKSLHDFSVEAMQLRVHYAERLRALGNGALEAEAQRLERQYAAICSGQRMTYRMEWWKELQQSRSMEHYWDMWRSSRKHDDLWRDLHTVDTQLRRMPDGLYARIGDLACLFSTLRYRDDVTRSVLWDIYTLLLLRERICRELGIAMKPLPLDAYGVQADEDGDSFTPELTDARLAEAVEECRPIETRPGKGTESKSLFHDIVQHECPDELVERLHQLMDGRKGADVGCVLLKCMQDGLITRKPKQKEFESEFTLLGGWTAIHNYMDENSEKALDRANKVIIF